MVDPSKYVVLDVETTGLNPKHDDLISISIYKPDEEEIYNRFLPLEKSCISEENYGIHHIAESDLADKQPLAQDEVFKLLVDFELSSRTILTFGGRNFDKRFLLQYCQDHRLTGLDYLEYFDFKTMVHSSGDSLNPASKDNLCVAFGIENVSDVHSSENDCKLEWELFKRMNGSHLLVTGSKVFKLTPDYVFPASYIDRYSGLRAYSNIPKRYLSSEKVFELKLSLEETEALDKLPNNFTGNAIEHLINTMLEAKKIDSQEMLLSNKSKLTYVGSFDGSAIPVYTEKRKDGSIALASSIYDEAIAALTQVGGYDCLISVLADAKINGCLSVKLNNSETAMSQYTRLLSSDNTLSLAKELKGLVNQSKITDLASASNNILKGAIPPLIRTLKQILGSDIKTQELVINKADNCLALCDLSSSNAVVEIKTGWNGKEAKKFTNQLYYSSAGRDCYLLYVIWGGYNRTIPEEDDVTKFVLEKISFSKDAPKRRNLRKTPRIRHAVMDWRHLNPSIDDYRVCALELQLPPDEVEKTWEKGNPDRFPLIPPKNGASLKTFKWIARWRASHPNDTRLDLHDDLNIQFPTIEKWWYLASPITGEEDTQSSKLENSLAQIKNAISDLSDISHTYSLYSYDELMDLRNTAEDKSYASGLSYQQSLALFNLPFQDDLKDKSKRKECVTALKTFIAKCNYRIKKGYRTLRVPLRLVGSRRRGHSLLLDASSVRIRHANAKIQIFASGTKVVSIPPRLKELHNQASSFVDKTPIDIFIDRSLLTGKSSLVLVFRE